MKNARKDLSVKTKENNFFKNKKYKFIFISSLCAIIPFIVIPPIAIAISKSVSNSKDNTNNNSNLDSIITNSNKLKFNLGETMRRNIEQYFSISFYSSEYINSLKDIDRIKIFSQYFNGINLDNWNDIFEEFKILDFKKSSQNFIEKNVLRIHAKTKNNYYFSDGTQDITFDLNWEYNNSFTLKITEKIIIDKVKEISMREEYFDDQFVTLDTLEKKFNFFNEIFKNDFNDFYRFKEAVSIFEITSNNNGNPWLNSIRLQFQFKSNYKFSNGLNSKINQNIEWGYTPNVSKVVFRHIGYVETGNKQTLRALVGGLTTEKRITFNWYRNGNLLHNKNTNEITFNSAFKWSAILDYDGVSFDELVRIATDTYTVDVFYNGKKIIDHKTDANRIKEFKFIAKPKTKYSFNANNIKVSKQAFLRAPNFVETIIDRDGIFLNGGCLDKYVLNIDYKFDELVVYKLARTKVLKFEVVSTKKQVDLWGNLNESHNGMFLNSWTQYPMCELFNKGDSYPIIRVSQNYDFDVDKIFDFNLVNGTRILHNFKF